MDTTSNNKLKNKKLHVINVNVENVTCFSIQEKYNVNCKRTSCKEWVDNSKCNNCILVAAKSGPKTLHEIGQYFDLTRMRICQIEKMIYRKIDILE